MITYEEALEQGRKAGGVAHQTDEQFMAGFLDSTAQILLGAVLAKLIWQGAQVMGFTSLELAALIKEEPDAARELMWVETP